VIVWQRLKLVVSGPVGAGKTTFIQSLCDDSVVETDEVASEAIGKEKTTVAMDFGRAFFGDLELFVFGTPGQERFSFAWDVLMEGAFGLVFLVAGDRPASFPAARRMLDYFVSNFAVPVVVGVTRQDLPRVWAPEDVAAYLRLSPKEVLGLNATSRADSRRALLRVLELWGVGGEGESAAEGTVPKAPQ